MRLHVFTLVLCVVFAGCGAFAPPDTSQESKVFRSVVVSNVDTDPHTVDVVVLSNGSVVHWTTERIEAKQPASETNATFDIADSATVAPPVLENTTRRYEVLIRLENRTSGVRYAPEDDVLNDCYSIGAEIRNGTLGGPVIHHWADDYCAEPRNQTNQTWIDRLA